MVEDKISPMEVNTDLNIESKLVLLPEGNRWILILIFLLGDSNMPTFNEGFNIFYIFNIFNIFNILFQQYSPPIFPSPGFNNTMASDAVGRSIIQLAENKSHSLDFIFSGTTITDGCLQGIYML